MFRTRFGKVTLVVAAFAASFALLSSGFVNAGIPAALEIGKVVPDFSMKDYDGKEHTLSAEKGKVVVLSFTSQKCPYSRGAEGAFAKLAQDYAAKGVVFYSIDSHAETTPAEIKDYATTKNETGKTLPYPILKDEGNKYADALGAKQTPEVFVVDKDGKLAYHGALDNAKKMSDSDYKSYVQAAVDELLAGKPVSEPTKSAYGCGIRRKAV